MGTTGSRTEYRGSIAAMYGATVMAHRRCDGGDLTGHPCPCGRLTLTVVHGQTRRLLHHARPGSLVEVTYDMADPDWAAMLAALGDD